jgi:prepilin-type N-terminal cleavage/methylation domain-containing protein
MKKENGFTLVEAIVALFIGSLMLVAIYAAVNSAQRSSSGVERRVSAQQDARGALDLMAMEIQMASYNSFSSRIWANTTCSGLSGNQEYKGIQEATANSITIEMDITNPAGTAPDGDGIISGPNEIIRYNYDSTTNNNYITRSTNCAGGQPFLGAAAANADTKTVSVVNNTAGTGGTAIPVFRYYNGEGTELTAPVTTSIPDIRRIEITLVVDTASSDQGTNTRRRIIYSTSVIPRNHSIPFI